MPDEHRYDDIINLPHHTSPVRPRMSRINRAAQFAPFAALTGFDDTITETARLTEAKIELSEAEQAELSNKLSDLKTRLSESPMVSITYFQPDGKKQGGEYFSITGKVVKIREYEKKLIMNDRTIINFDDILSIEENNVE